MGIQEVDNLVGLQILVDICRYHKLLCFIASSTPVGDGRERRNRAGKTGTAFSHLMIRQLELSNLWRVPACISAKDGSPAAAWKDMQPSL